MTDPHTQPVHVSVLPERQTSGRQLLSPLVALLIIILIGGAIFSALTYQAGIRETIRVSESIAFETYLDQKAVVDVETFYEGIAVEGISLGGKTIQEARQLIGAYSQKQRDAVALTVQVDTDTRLLTAADIHWSDDSLAILDQAYAIGRTSHLATDREQVQERYDTVTQLRDHPVDLQIHETFSKSATIAAIQAFADPLWIDAKPAKATGFDLTAQRFIFDERVVGRSFDLAGLQSQAIDLLESGQFQGFASVASKPVVQGLSADQMQDQLTLLGSATTYAYKTDPPRDNNLTQASERINGIVLQPGQIFSFNEVVGKRTLENGFMEAGVISDGTLIKELGGGICQVNTTVMQAAMKSDYQLIERYPHSWPSSYTKIGLDATVDWGGVDFKFKNNSDLPLAIVATYVKPHLTVKVYGRRLEDGVTIALKSTHDGYIEVEPPVYRANPTLAPGSVVEIRAEHIGQRATAYKVYTKDKVVLREEVLFKSYYRPIQGIYEVGPAVVSVDPTAATSAAASLND